MIYWEGANLAFADGKYELRVYPSFGKGSWQYHRVYWDEWSGQRKSKGTASTAEEVLLEVTLCCIPVANPSAATYLAITLAAPKSCCLPLLCGAVHRSHQGRTRLLRYIPLRQSLGHLETRFAVLLSFAVHVTVKWHTAKISGHALATHCEDPQEMPEVSPRL